VNLRPMTSDDMPVVMALEQELFPEDAWPPEMFASELAESGPASRRLYLVAEAAEAAEGQAEAAEGQAEAAEPRPAETLIGYAGMLFTDGAEADVLTMAVRPRHWGHGTGSALLEALLREAARRKCAQVFLEVRRDNPRAQRLYQRHGFTEIGIRRGYYQPSGTDAIVMRKDLDTA
jgi:ribosomal-protein-alanine N-acetyltransferase